MSKQMQWSKFWWSDWARDAALRRSSYAAKGLWMDMLCHMDASDERGFLVVNGCAAAPADIAKIVGGERRQVERLLAELETNGVFSRDERGAIFSRRMTRDEASSKRNTANGLRGGNPALRQSAAAPQQNDAGLQQSAGDLQPSGNSDANEINEIAQKSVKPPLKAEADKEKEAEKKERPVLRTVDHLAFDEWWSAYPRKIGKDKARTAYASAVKRGATPAVLLLAIRRAAWPADPQFIPYPTTWLAQGRWQDEQPQASPARMQPVGKVSDMEAYLIRKRKAREAAEREPDNFAGTTLDLSPQELFA